MGQAGWGQGLHSTAVCLAKAQERSLGNAQEQHLAKPNGVEEDGGKMGGENPWKWLSQGWKSLLGVQLCKHGLLEVYSSPRSDHKTWHSFCSCPPGSPSLRAGCTGGAGPFACEVMCNRWMAWKLPQGHSLSLGFMRLRHEANKEKESSIDQDLEVFNANCSLAKGRKHELFMEDVEEPTARAVMVLLGLGSRKKSFEGGRLLIPNRLASSTRDNERVFRHILSAVLAAVA